MGGDGGHGNGTRTDAVVDLEGGATHTTSTDTDATHALVFDDDEHLECSSTDHNAGATPGVARSGGAGGAGGAGGVGGKACFLTSPFTSKVDYESWVAEQGQGQGQQAPPVAQAGARGADDGGGTAGEVGGGVAVGMWAGGAAAAAAADDTQAKREAEAARRARCPWDAFDIPFFRSNTLGDALEYYAVGHDQPRSIFHGHSKVDTEDDGVETPDYKILLSNNGPVQGAVKQNAGGEFS